jgi:excisionase family DNA binding protein|tara:strand:- start:390 stop:686 length:297 start_codon:yes stop_codon:yes gene_type:complete
MNENEAYVPIEAIAKHLSVSISTIRVWVRQGVIPTDTYIKIGSTYRFKPSSVVDALHKAMGEDYKPIKKALKDEVDNKIPVVDRVHEDQLEFDFDEDR